METGSLPPKDAVRIEELVNYFTYDYVPAEGRRAVCGAY
jgi:Ca-activated chloride channel family protein